MTTINSLSGGQTSSYIAVNYPADYNLFCLVRTNDKEVLFPDDKIRQIVSDKIGVEFIGTLEDDDIIYTMLDLEQYIGQEIIWLSEVTFEEVIKIHGDYLPNVISRFCTIDMKIKPIAQWCYKNTELPVEMRIGFRANEMNRAKTMIDKAIDGIENFKFKVGEKNGRNKFKELPYRMVKFPLIEDAIFKDNVVSFWKDKPVRFAYKNNCVGCFNRNELLLKHMSTKNEKQFDWFVKMEKKNNSSFKNGITYERIKKHMAQFELFDDDFNDCDSGYCGI